MTAGLLTRITDALRLTTARPVLHRSVDVGEGPVVVLLHGLASSWHTFSDLVPLLEPRHRVIALDLLGFGLSVAPPSTGFTIDEHVDAVATSLRRLRLGGPVILVGHSLGALVAARLAATTPRLVRHLVMISPPIYPAAGDLTSSIDQAAMRAYTRAFDFLRSNKQFTIRNATVLARLLPMQGILEVTEANWHAFALSLENSIQRQSTIVDVASVTVPVDVVYGSLDPLLLPAGIKVIGSMRQVTVHRVDGGDHVLRKRIAAAVAAVVDDDGARDS
ncbi:alpha/beta fold hydrolase [Galbitalea soli]|uniref:Alpha/beta hydrolase n=1 Tax=Galbitalea soli TaxID=1268042 RepID=A0A7C9TN04_9MICO|nr:alpha/beta hydrolase [Galbitalea soli]NEM90077.1 alpha/beta hydrolase [Galbitalea soli]NYJ30784.1 pimeloyl-ACP methyl ester carboxylesterase [Galbitalea soli]